MKEKYLILDIYADEPTCLGVPPFISPYPRYVYGALICAGVKEDDISYKTIDNLRSSSFIIEDSDIKVVFLVGGASVPGKYLGFDIASERETNEIISKNKGKTFFLGGLISYNQALPLNKNAFAIKKDIEYFAYTYVKNGDGQNEYRNYDELSEWAYYGANVVKKHPEYPDLIAEIETYRGCRRLNHCSFCSEYIYTDKSFREQESILKEIDMLTEAGITRFRIGRQADILAYKSNLSEYKNGFPKPSYEEVAYLFNALKSRDKITTLNIDNANAGTIANYPDISSKIIEVIGNSITPGDTMPFGIETFDDALIKQNALKVNRENSIKAIKIVNDIAGGRMNGIPKLLPGVNIIQGLMGESKDTFKINYETLKIILDSNLLLRRINMRKVLPFRGTLIDEIGVKHSETLDKKYDYYKEKIRKEIDAPMLKKIYKTGTILNDVKIYENRSDYSYGKQIASYSIICKIPEKLDIKSKVNIIIIGHSERSLIGLPYPIDINNISATALKYIDGISSKRATDIVLARPFKNADEVKSVAPYLSSEIILSIKII